MLLRYLRACTTFKGGLLSQGVDIGGGQLVPRKPSLRLVEVAFGVDLVHFILCWSWLLCKQKKKRAKFCQAMMMSAS